MDSNYNTAASQEGGGGGDFANRLEEEKRAKICVGTEMAKNGRILERGGKGFGCKYVSNLFWEYFK